MANTVWPGVQLSMFTMAEPPGTSGPLSLAETNFAWCVCELPVTQTRPTVYTVSGLEPTVKAMPTNPVKLLRNGGEFKANPVTRCVTCTKFAVTVCGALPMVVVVAALLVFATLPVQFVKA